MNQAERYHDSLHHRSALKSWLAVLSVALGAFVFVTSEFLPIGLLTQISAGLHVSDGTAGLMVTIPGLVATFAAPLMTIGAGKVDRRILMLGLTIRPVSRTEAFASTDQNSPRYVSERRVWQEYAHLCDTASNSR